MSSMHGWRRKNGYIADVFMFDERIGLDGPKMT
jgi:hypothetical protein